MASNVTDMTEDERAFLQQRVALFGKVTLTIALLAASVVALANARRLSWFVHPSVVWVLIGTGASAGVWLSCRRGRRSARFCRTVEAAGLLAYALAFLVLGRFLFVQVMPNFAVFLGIEEMPPTARALMAGMGRMGVVMMMAFALTYIVVLRAALVPSPPLYTALLTAAGGIPLGLTCGNQLPGVDAANLAAMGMRPTLGIVGVGLVWWCFTMIVCTVISRVIYGLHRQVREAQQLGQYSIEEQLGEGGMGVVYQAKHALLRRPTAVKLLPPDKAGEASIARFEREVQLTARLTHPNTVTIYDYGRTPDGVFYYAMELIDGGTLETIVEHDGAQPAGRVLKVLSEVAGALEEAHAIELIHRDIKPANIMLCEQGGQPDVSKLLDFGLVKAVDAEGDEDVQLTREGTITGTPAYLAPETLTDPSAVDARADLYAVGAVGYFLLTGTHVFSGRTMVEICSHHLHSKPDAPSKRLDESVDEDLEQVLLDCLAKDPAERPQSAAELRKRLRACQSRGSWTTEDARSWWRDHGKSLRARRDEERISATAATIAVDLQRARSA